MSENREPNDLLIDDEQIIEAVGYRFGLKRRSFVQLIATGLMIAAAPLPSPAQQRRRGGFGGDGARNVWARIHIGRDGVITVLTGKVEVGQGSRAEITQAAAEELRVAADQIQLTMADTALVPNDGITAGSGSTPRTVPSVRGAAASARMALLDLAAARWNVEASSLEIRDAKITDAATKRTLTFAELAQGDALQKAFEQAAPNNGSVTPVKDWKVLGASFSRPNARDLVTGAHDYPSDIKRPGMWYGKVLRQPSYGAKLVSLDIEPAKAMKDVIVVQDGSFTGVVAGTTFLAEQAIALLAKNAKWETAPHPSSKELYDYLGKHANIPANQFTGELAAAKHKLKATYHAAYVQHAPMETRAAVAEWKDGRLTVWAGTQNPFGHQNELMSAFRLGNDSVRVIVPDTGGGFGGKHTGEASVEAARLAQGAGKPVVLKWTRGEEFTWAAFRPAALIECEASLDDAGKLTSWYFVNVNSGGSAIATPYRAGRANTPSVNSQAVLRHSSYRGLAATANNFAREAFMDELAAAAGADPLEFRLAHLEPGRLRDVLEAAARKFNWRERVKHKDRDTGVGLACGTEKGSYVAACVEVAIDRAAKKIVPRHVCQAYECGAIINPANLRAQVEGAILMGLGPALREEMRFDNGVMQNAAFSEYRVPRLKDVPELDIHLMNRTDLASAGAGETPIICIAPAIANAVFHATGDRLREMPLRLPDAKPS